MYGMKKSPNSDGNYPEVAAAEARGARVMRHDDGIAAYCVPKGTPGGRPKVALVAVLKTGETVVLETSLKLLLDATDDFRALHSADD